MLPGLAAQINATEERYSSRSPERESKAKKGILEANEPERIEKRLKRLRSARAIVPSAADLGIERIIQENDLLAVRYLELGLQTARCVGRVRIRDRGRTIGFGTGFMVAPRLLLTNNHVLESDDQAAQSQVEFNFQDGLEGKPLPTSVFALSPAELFITNRDLDYTLVAVSPRATDGSPLETFGFTRLIEEEGKLIVKEAVSIIQHPNGEPKQLAIRENRVVDILPNFVHYQTDTAPGSSGSPVLNDQWEVVALHHSGVPKRDANGNILAIDGSIWKPSMGDQKIDWISNEGVRVSRIVADIKSQPLDSDAAKKLRDTLVSANESTLLPSASAGPSSLAGDTGGIARWTIPLQITVQVGGPQFAPATSTQIPLTVVGGGQLPASGVPADETDSELQAALAAARAGKTKPYYEEERDKQERDSYYSGVAENLSRAELFNALSVLVRQTHKVKPRYQPALHVYPFVDLQPNRKLQSIYTLKEFEPEELIRAHFEIRREIARQVRETLLTESLDLTQMAERINLLEAAAQFNCEHVVPQSWFDKREPMRGDLHHLFACEPDCNSFRSNTPYCDFTDFGEAIRTNCGKSAVASDGDRGFEPGGGKGAVTRAVMYFLLRYPGEINNTGREFKASQLPTLVQWHKAFPPSLYEQHRNQAIFAVQGNRNPLIDFPDRVDQIDFELGLG